MAGRRAGALHLACLCRSVACSCGLDQRANYTSSLCSRGGQPSGIPYGWTYQCSVIRSISSAWSMGLRSRRVPSCRGQSLCSRVNTRTLRNLFVTLRLDVSMLCNSLYIIRLEFVDGIAAIIFFFSRVECLSPGCTGEFLSFPRATFRHLSLPTWPTSCLLPVDTYWNDRNDSRKRSHQPQKMCIIDFQRRPPSCVTPEMPSRANFLLKDRVGYSDASQPRPCTHHGALTRGRP